MVFNAALSGIQASSSELNIVGNNIANSGTVGFKQSRAEFADVYASSALGTSSNAIGSGVRLSEVRQLFSQGNISFTENNLDLAVNGQGFFVLNDNGSTVYSRAGNFGVDREGYIVNSSSQRLIGLTATSSGEITGLQGELQLDTSNIAPAATTKIDLGVNLQANADLPLTPFDPADGATFNDVTSATIYDSLGNPHAISMYFAKNTSNNVYDVYFRINGDTPTTNPTHQLEFDANGDLVNTGLVNVVQPLSNGAAALNFNVDFSKTTQYGSPFAVESILTDGFATGRLDSVDIDSEGLIFGRYTNGQSKTLGKVQLANFANVNGLQPLGDTSWGESFDSGQALISDPGTASLGLLTSGALEDSNVDLTSELVRLITAQRNFQANAQTISTADTVTQTIINLR